MKKYIITIGLFCLSAGAFADGLDVTSYGKWADETSDTSVSKSASKLASQPKIQQMPVYETVEPAQSMEPEAPAVDAAPAPQAAPLKIAAYRTSSIHDGPANAPEVHQPAAADNSIADENPVEASSMAMPIAADQTMTEDPVEEGIDGPTAGHGVFSKRRTSVPVDHTYVQTNHTEQRNRGGSFWHYPDVEVTLLAGGSGSYIPVNEGLVDTQGFDDPAKYKFHLSGEGFTGGLGISTGYRLGNNTFGAMFTGYVDSHTLKNYDHKNDIYGGSTNNSMTFLSRSYTLELAAKAGHYFNNLPVVNDLHLYGKLGVICSAFQYKYRNPGVVDARKTMTAWGGVAGVGLQKTVNLPVLNEAKIGLEYAYHIYQALTPVIRYNTNVDTSKLRPRYHNGYLTISKAL